MGIKFKCPNGHKLNVKSFLAGRKGMCPHCGVKFRIPETPAEDDHDDGPALDVSQQLPQPVAGVAAQAADPATSQASSPPSGTVQPQPAMTGAPAVATSVRPATPVGGAGAVPMGTATGSAAPGSPTPVSAVPGSAIPVGTPAGLPVGQAIPVGAVPTGAAIAPVDPIAENPNAIWYVRPPSGGQYGPARGDVMRKWIAEGRVSGTSLVWREGWTDWRSAADALPGLSGPAASAADPAADVIVAPATARVTNRYVSRKKKSNAAAIAALVLLTLVCLAMVAVLVVVLGGVQLGGPA